VMLGVGVRVAVLGTVGLAVALQAAQLVELGVGEGVGVGVTVPVAGLTSKAYAAGLRVAIDPERQDQPALTHAQVLELVRLGRRIETHLGHPQDIEWCLADGGFQIVQSRPVTTLFPIPVSGDSENHIYVSVVHQQMMTDPMKPLGLSFWQLTTRRPMSVAGGRLFVDVAPLLGSPATREGYLDALGRSDPLIGDALRAVLDRGDFIEPANQRWRDAYPHAGRRVLPASRRLARG